MVNQVFMYCTDKGYDKRTRLFTLCVGSLDLFVIRLSKLIKESYV